VEVGRSTGAQIRAFRPTNPHAETPGATAPSRLSPGSGQASLTPPTAGGPAELHWAQEKA
jgi:hypothetical protein